MSALMPRETVPHLNYCRQFLRQCTQFLSWPGATKEKRVRCQYEADLCRLSEKFLLPLNGCVLADEELRAIDESTPLKLPFKAIALEFPIERIKGFNKAILFCRESDDGIRIWPAVHQVSSGQWYSTEDYGLPRTGYIERAEDGITIVTTMFPSHGDDPEDQATLTWFAGVLLGVLNALECSNVQITRSEPPKLKAKLKKAFPFDSYHILTIARAPNHDHSDDSTCLSHRSPREHLRRGHIRRYATGLKVWVNAHVVNAGIGGRVSKDYRVAA